MAHFYVYADESGNIEKNDFVSFCGYLAHNSEWEGFSMEWNSFRLRWDMPPVHMREIMHPGNRWDAVRTRWGTMWEDKRKEIIQDIGLTIRRSNIVCLGAVIDAAHFRRMPESNFTKFYKHPNYLAMQEMLGTAVNKLQTLEAEGHISLVMDDNQQYAIDFYNVLTEIKKTETAIRQRVRGMCFVDDVHYPGVQAADVIAYEARKFLVDRISDPTARPSELLDNLTMEGANSPKRFTPAFLDECAKIMASAP